MNQRIQSLKTLLNNIVTIDQNIMITGISNDSRSVNPGDLFIATLGNAVDARQFIPTVIKQGASAVVYENHDGYQFNVSTTIPVFPVAHLNQWEGIIASRFYDTPSQLMRCIGVTGTNGKTSCTQWIAQMLNANHIRCGIMGTLGSGFWPKLDATGYTTPNPVLLQSLLANLYDQGASAIALEVSSHALTQHRLEGMCFDVGVFTQLSRDHLDYHGNMERYAAAKKRLFEWRELKAGVINIDDPVGAQWAAHFSKHYPVISYSLKNSSALIYASKITTQDKGFLVSVKSPWGDGDFFLPFLGQFNISNALAVLGVVAHFDLPFKHALQMLDDLQFVPGRMETFGGNEQPLVIVDYSHTPDALKKALIALQEHNKGRIWCVFGCGGDRDRGKRAEMAKIAETYSDCVIVTNDNPRTESPEHIVSDIMAGFSEKKQVTVELNRAQAIVYAIKNAAVNDTILIAGKGHENYQIIGKKRFPFSDSEQVKQQLGTCMK